MKKRIILSLLAPSVVLTILPVQAAAASIQSQLAGKIYSVVAADGSGNYTKVQAAITAIPDSNPTPKVIFLKKGTYTEKIIIPWKKTNIILVGENVDSCVITHTEAATPNNLDTNTFNTYTLRVDPNDFMAMNLTIQNPATAAQAVALHTQGDRQVFLHCRIVGNTDTYFNNIRTRQYLKDCYIQGTGDYIFGFGIDLFDSCLVNTTSGSGSMTAGSTSNYYRFGFVFRNCSFEGTTGFYLGRPWFAYDRTVIINCYEPTQLNAAGWAAWAGREDTAYLREYKCTGPGFKPTSRPSWAGQLTDQQATSYQLDTIFSHLSFPQGHAQDSAEIAFILHRWLVSTTAGMEQMAKDTILLEGRDTIPPIPTTDWLPVVDTNSIYAVIKANTVMFMDTGKVTRIQGNGENSSFTGPRIRLDGFHNNRINFAINAPHAGKITLCIFNVAGRVVYSGEFSTASGNSNDLSCNTDFLKPGAYLYKVNMEGIGSEGKFEVMR